MENNNHVNSPIYADLHKRQGKDSENLAIKPDFSSLSDPSTILEHTAELKKVDQATPHTKILWELQEQIDIVDFEALANPHGVENFKIGNKHYLILSIENLLELAKKNRWDLGKNNNSIYIYNGRYWRDIEKDMFQSFLGAAAEKMGVSKFSARYHKFQKELFDQFLAAAYLPTPEPDNKVVLVNLLNGTFKVSPDKIELKPFDSADFLTYQLPFEYDPDAKAPIFEKYLNRVLPDKELQKVLAEYMGFILIRHGSNTLKEEKALILYGTGANGKSVFFEVINALLGSENVSSYPLQDLTEPNGYHRAKIATTLVNYASEINGKLETAIFKQLVSGEPVSARLPYGQPFTMKHYAKLIFNVNELPKDVEHTNAYFRRFLIIPFDVTIPEAEQDKTLHTKIIENELSGVFNWVLDGLHRLLKQKRFTYSEAAQKAVEQYKVESSSIRLFLTDYNYQKTADSYILIKDLYPEYKGYCVEDGMTPFKKQNFIKQIKGLGYLVERNNDGYRIYVGKNIHAETQDITDINTPF